jgi:hypothetical protein
LVDGLASAISVLENGARRGPVSERQLAHRLRALIVSGGYTSDPRGLRQRSNNPLRGSAARAMLVSAPKRQR